MSGSVAKPYEHSVLLSLSTERSCSLLVRMSRVLTNVAAVCQKLNIGRGRRETPL